MSFRDDGAIRVEMVELEGSVRMLNPNRGVARLTMQEIDHLAGMRGACRPPRTMS
jgi:hypothetical protein